MYLKTKVTKNDRRNGQISRSPLSFSRQYALQRKMGRAVTSERVRIVRDIHDTVGHKLMTLLVQMQSGPRVEQAGFNKQSHAGNGR